MEVGPAWRVKHTNALDGDVGRIVGQEKNWAKVGVAGIENLEARKAIIPSLTVSVERALAVDLYLLATPDPESDGFLEWVVEVADEK